MDVNVKIAGWRTEPLNLGMVQKDRELVNLCGIDGEILEWFLDLT